MVREIPCWTVEYLEPGGINPISGERMNDFFKHSEDTRRELFLWIQKQYAENTGFRLLGISAGVRYEKDETKLYGHKRKGTTDGGLAYGKKRQYKR